MIQARPKMRVEVEHRDVGFLALSGRILTPAGTAGLGQDRTFSCQVMRVNSSVKNFSKSRFLGLHVWFVCHSVDCQT